MIFNIASAALISQSYQQNMSNDYIDYIAYVDNTMYTLSVIDAVLIVVLGLFSFAVIPCLCSNAGPAGCLGCPIFEANLMVFAFLIIIFGPFDFIYSLHVIKHHNDQLAVTEQLFNMSLAIMILNSAFFVIMCVCSCLCVIDNR